MLGIITRLSAGANLVFYCPEPIDSYRFLTVFVDQYRVCPRRLLLTAHNQFLHQAEDIELDKQTKIGDHRI